MVTDLLRSRSAPGAAAPSGLYVARRSGAEYFLPAAAPPVTISAPGNIGSWGAWTAVGTPANDFLLSQVHFVGLDPGCAIGAWVLELSYGASHTAREAVRCQCATSDPTSDAASDVPGSHTCRSVVFPAGEVIYGRLAVQTPAARNAEVYLAGWDGALPTWVDLAGNVPAGPGRYYPSNNSAAGIDLITGAGWAYGAPVTAVAAAPNDLLVAGVVALLSVSMWSAAAYILQVGFGPAGGETWCATVPFGHAFSPPTIWPPVLVLAGERVALRGAGGGAVHRQFLPKVYDL